MHQPLCQQHNTLLSSESQIIQGHRCTKMNGGCTYSLTHSDGVYSFHFLTPFAKILPGSCWLSLSPVRLLLKEQSAMQKNQPGQIQSNQLTPGKKNFPANQTLPTRPKE